MLPKPEPRGPKPRRHIRRGKPPARRSRPAAQRRTPRAATLRELAYRWRVKVRAKEGGICVALLWQLAVEPLCSGRITAAHCFGVDEAPGLRVTLWNGVPLCAGHHEFYERRKLTAWASFLMRMWGPYIYAERLGLARSTVKVDLAEARRELEAA